MLLVPLGGAGSSGIMTASSSQKKALEGEYGHYEQGWVGKSDADIVLPRSFCVGRKCGFKHGSR